MNTLLKKKFLSNLPIINRYVKKNQELNVELIRLEVEVEKLTSMKNLRSPGLDYSYNDLLTENLLSHPVIEPFPDVHLGKSYAEDNPQRIMAAQRLLVAYNKSISDEQQSLLKHQGEGLWTDLIRNELPELMSIIKRNHAESLADYLQKFGESFVWFGGITTCIDGYNKNLTPQHIALTYLDKLVCIGEYLGLLPFENPENGPWGANLQININELVSDIENVLGVSITPPSGVIYTDGLQTKNGLFHYRHINGLYSAIRIKELSISQTNNSCCEFGGGIGLVALYARRMGILNYTMLDLPITCLLAGHYLLHSVGMESVSLYGEEQKSDTINILPYWECMSLPSNQYHLSLNQDSFPEIADDLLDEYLEQIKRITSNYFLSFNHEYFYPRTVNNFTKKAKGYQRIYRSKYWVREGYIEELFQIL